MSHTLYVVAGMHRSGTSVVARMLEVYGISLPGELVGPASDNEKGFFEDKAIVAINDELFRMLDLRWDSMSGFFLGESDFSNPKFNHVKKKARELLEERVAHGQDWAFKDPRISRLCGFWLPLFDRMSLTYKFVISIRDPAEVAGSLAKRNSFPHIKSVYLWTLYTLDLLIASRKVPSLILHYEKILAKPEAVISANVSYFENQSIDESALIEFSSSFITHDLQHNSGSLLDCEVEVADRVYGLLKEGGNTDMEILQLRDELTGNSALQQLLTYASASEIASDAAQLRERNELTAVIEQHRKDAGDFRSYQTKLETDLKQHRKDIGDFKSYQTKLETDLKEQKNWSAKLESDVDELNRNVSTLGKTVSKKSVQIDSLNADLRQVEKTLAVEVSAGKAEASRLWEIIEKYRVQVELMEGSISWRITNPLRVTRRFVQSAPGHVWLKLKQAARALVYLLPADGLLRQRIIKIHERSRQVARGEVDNASIRASHRSIISSRTNLLGAKGLMGENELPVLDMTVVTYNSGKWVQKFTDSLFSQDYPLAKLALTVVDNGSSDDTVSKLQKIDWSVCRRFELIESENRGYGAGHNQAIVTGDSEFVLITNIDLTFRHDSICRALSFAIQDVANVASWELRQSPFEHPKFYDPVTLQTGWSSHACILIRREALTVSGGYEEKIFMYGEDVELSYRFRSLGYKLRYLPSAVVDHYTYEEPGEVKSLQFQGSTLANAYIRLRYGSIADVLGILILYAGLATGRSGVEGSLSVVKGNVASILKNALYFLGKRSGKQEFSFRGWDYDIVRTGAFYQGEPVGAFPLVSVITRSYKGRDSLLRECLQSVAHQTYWNVEHIVVEDGGDSLGITIAEFEEAYPAANIRYFSIEKRGRCHAGNSGLDKSRGQYVMFLDDDDLLFSDHIEICIGELQCNPKLGGVYALAWEVETEFVEDGYVEMSHGTPDAQHQEYDRDVLLHHNYIPIQSVLFKRELYLEHGGFDPELEKLEDWNLWIRYSQELDFKLINKTTSMYRTPWDVDEKSRRQSILDQYLPVARAKNEMAAR